jgi:hypothetical protein
MMTLSYAEFEILTAVVMKSSILWDTRPCSQLKLKRRFGGKCRIHPDFLLGLFFDTEDGSGMFLRNVGLLSIDYMASYPEDRTLHTGLFTGIGKYLVLYRTGKFDVIRVTPLEVNVQIRNLLIIPNALR